MRLLSLFALLLLTGCSSVKFDYCVQGADEFVLDSYQIRQGKLSILAMQGKCEPCLPSDALCEYKDAIVDDDILEIAIYHPSREDLVDAFERVNQTIGFRVWKGKISLPNISPVVVAGLSLDEAMVKLQEEYRKEIKDVEVFIRYKDRLSRKVDLVGLVAIPHLPVDGKIRLYEALSIAKVPYNANFFKSYVVRDGCQLPIDMFKLIHEGDMCQNIVLQGGDKIFIAHPEDSCVMVMGEVLVPTPVPLSSGYKSLREVLVDAGGIPYTGDRNCIQVIRGSLPEPKIYRLSWDHVIHLPNESLLLIPGDTVYVSAKPITEWNRFIGQLLPSFSGVQTGFNTYQLLR